MQILFTNNKQVLKLALIIALGLFFACSIALARYIYKTSLFVNVDAIITDIKNVNDNRNSHNLHRNRYIEYSFNYSGKKYVANKLVLFTFHQVGDKTIIKVNPNKPSEVKNGLYEIIYTLTIALCVFLICIVIRRLTVTN